MSSESIRTFIALEIDKKIKKRIVEVQDRIKQTNSLKGKWVPKENLHLTLKFLGDTKLKFIEQIKDKIKEYSEDEHAMSYSLTHIGAFPNEKFARIIWAGIEGDNSQIINLARKLEEALFEFGFKKEKRDFKTHITFCRTKQILDHNGFRTTLEEINKSFQPIEFIINKIILFESNLTPTGPIYSALFNYYLK